MTMQHTPSPEDAAFLADWKFKEPRYPYVLFRQKHVEILDPTHKPEHAERPGDHMGLRPYESVTVLNVDGCHCQPEKIRSRWLKLKKCKVISWGNFPEPGEQRAKVMVGADGRTPWQTLELALKQELGEMAADNERINVLDAKVKALEKELAEKAKGKKDA